MVVRMVLLPTYAGRVLPVRWTYDEEHSLDYSFFSENVPAALMAHAELLMTESCLKCSHLDQALGRSDIKE
jgi:hypothetical protein